MSNRCSAVGSRSDQTTARSNGRPHDCSCVVVQSAKFREDNDQTANLPRITSAARCICNICISHQCTSHSLCSTSHLSVVHHICGEKICGRNCMILSWTLQAKTCQNMRIRSISSLRTTIVWVCLSLKSILFPEYVSANKLMPFHAINARQKIVWCSAVGSRSDQRMARSNGRPHTCSGLFLSRSDQRSVGSHGESHKHCTYVDCFLCHVL